MRAFPTALLLVCALALSARAETLDTIPRPRPGTWSVDTTGLISAETHAEVNQLGEEVVRQGHGQLAVVVVKSTEGQAPRAFATQLFNRWGLGRTRRNDGALLFIALDDRKAEIVLGEGVDSGEDTRRSDALMSGEIIPAFKRGSPDGAVLAGARGLSQLLEQSPLNRPESAPGLPREDGPGVPAPRAGESIGGQAATSLLSQKGVMWGLGAAGFGVLATGFALAVPGLRRWSRRRPRRCAACKSRRVLLSEKAEDAHLKKGQRKEEKLGSVDYDVWWCESCEDARVERYDGQSSFYGKCAGCGYMAKVENDITLQAATHDAGGTVRVDVRCQHCTYRNSFTRDTPKRPRPSSSSSSKSPSFGASSSRSSSSSGGRSSGGGSSGSW